MNFLPVFLLFIFLMGCENAQKYYERGNSKQIVGDYNGAIKDFDKAIQLDPNYKNAYYGRAFTKRLLNDYKGAIADYDKALDLDPNDKDIYYMRGSAKAALDDYSGAITDYDKAIDIGIIYLKDNKNQQMLKNADSISIRVRIDNAKFYFYRGTAKMNVKDYKGAIEDYHKTLSLDPENNIQCLYAFFYGGDAKYFIGDYLGAIADYKQAMRRESNPKNKGYIYRARIKRAKAKIPLKK